jgi:hypothetical protein
VRKPIHGERVADAKSSRDVAFVASVMLGGRADIPNFNTMGCHVLSLVGREVDNGTSSRRGKGASVEIESTMKACMGGQLWLAARGAQEIERDVGLRH